VENVQNLDCLLLDAVRHDVRQASKHELARSLSLLKMSSGANVFEISDIQKDEAEAVQ